MVNIFYIRSYGHLIIINKGHINYYAIFLYSSHFLFSFSLNFIENNYDKYGFIEVILLIYIINQNNLFS